MTDYEIVRVANTGNPMIGKPFLTVSSHKVGIQYEVLMALGKPEYIIIRKGIRSNAGTLVIEAVEERTDGSMFVDYNRKKLCFYDRNFVEMCKSLVIEHSKGTFAPGVFYSINGERQENTVVFDFHKSNKRFVKGRGRYIAQGKGAKRTSPVREAESPQVKGRRNNPLAGYELL